MSSESSVRARWSETQAEQADRAEEANADEAPLFELMAVPDYRDVLLLELDPALLHRFRVSRTMRRWIEPILAARGVTAADVAAGIQVPVLRLLCEMENGMVRLARGQYEFEGDWDHEEHNSNWVNRSSTRSTSPVWHEKITRQ